MRVRKLKLSWSNAEEKWEFFPEGQKIGYSSRCILTGLWRTDITDKSYIVGYNVVISVNQDGILVLQAEGV